MENNTFETESLHLDNGGKIFFDFLDIFSTHSHCVSLFVCADDLDSKRERVYFSPKRESMRNTGLLVYFAIIFRNFKTHSAFFSLTKICFSPDF